MGQQAVTNGNAVVIFAVKHGLTTCANGVEKTASGSMRETERSTPQTKDGVGAFAHRAMLGTRNTTSVTKNASASTTANTQNANSRRIRSTVLVSQSDTKNATPRRCVNGRRPAGNVSVRSLTGLIGNVPIGRSTVRPTKARRLFSLTSISVEHAKCQQQARIRQHNGRLAATITAVGVTCVASRMQTRWITSYRWLRAGRIGPRTFDRRACRVMRVSM